MSVRVAVENNKFEELIEMQSEIAPFVMKTYQILSDPTTNGMIAWGRANNSFIVLEPLHFSQTILPLYFKHNNFSSFVRQLNTYGFRKVDPDRWEFANEWFLRGQTQLLSNIVRKKQASATTDASFMIKHQADEDDDDDDDDELEVEIAKLRQEQESLGDELESMSRRLQARERRPRQMMTFLCKVAQDPQILPQIMLMNNTNDTHLITYDTSSSKRSKIMESSSTSSSSSSSSSGMTISSSSVKSGEDLDGRISWCGGRSSVDCCVQSSEDERFGMCSVIRQEHHGYATLSSSSTAGAPLMNGSGGGVCLSYFEDLEMATQKPAPYPFSLLEGGF
ncbi:heat stress transcription factor C-1b-like [Salvia miltiorrhiza]|uniref:heat stress transcription factor C-1b-like n=1 Tax=Salvia miltiorrhiza TaxID=226208 RepID=UPI0025AB68D2|nr:heat stress transcription factor C-1b-like [Salvia miltiorrhiza]